MSVEELIAGLTAMGPTERRQIRAALHKLERDTAGEPPDPEAYLRGLAAWQELMDGVCEAPGQCLSEGIDEALYRDLP